MPTAEPSPGKLGRRNNRGRRKPMSKPGGALGGQARKMAAAAQQAAHKEEVKELRGSSELAVVLDDWWELTRQGAKLSKEYFGTMCRKTYKAIGDANGQVLHPGSDRAKECAQADWEASVGLLHTRTELS
eukprot:6132068-Prymnesium_polylepis.1